MYTKIDFILLENTREIHFWKVSLQQYKLEDE